MEHWLLDTDFAGVRGKEAVSRLPEQERQAWRKVWTEVAQLSARAREKESREKK
jgi:hypothetical protein